MMGLSVCFTARGPPGLGGKGWTGIVIKVEGEGFRGQCSGTREEICKGMILGVDSGGNGVDIERGEGRFVEEVKNGARIGI